MEDSINWDLMYELTDKLSLRGYKLKYANELDYILKNLIPERGQADTLQGELLREADKIRNEARNNGNINWDDNFSWFCDNISNVLLKCDFFDTQEKQNIKDILEYFKKCGEYAKDYRDGKLENSKVEPALLAYTDNDLYAYIFDTIARLYMENKELIPYEKNNFIYR